LREAVSVFTHLSEKGRRQDNAQAWEAQEQSGVRMTFQQLINCSLKGFQLSIQQSELLNQGERGSSFAGRRTGGSRKQVGSKSFDQTVSGLPTSITVGHKKARHPLNPNSSRLFWRRIAPDELQTDVAVK
jgi:hypothetical protein